MTFAIIAFICRWRPAHSKRRGGCAVGPFADALIILTGETQTDIYLSSGETQTEVLADRVLSRSQRFSVQQNQHSRGTVARRHPVARPSLAPRPSTPRIVPVSSCSFKFDWRTLCSTKWRRSAGSSSRAASNPSRIRRLRHPPRLHMLTKSPCPSLLGR